MKSFFKIHRIDYPKRRRSQEYSPYTDELRNPIHDPTTYSHTTHHSLRNPRTGRKSSCNKTHHAKFLQATSVDDTHAHHISNLAVQDVIGTGVDSGYGIVANETAWVGCGDKSFSTSHDAIACGGNIESVEILPIFHKLLEDKRSSHNELQNAQDQVGRDGNGGMCEGKTSSMEHSLTTSTTRGSVKNNGRSAHFNAASAKMRSCPDMSVRCDIVEYL